MWSLSVTDDRLSQAEAMARESPEFVVAAAVVAIVAIVGAYVLFRVRRTPGVKFHRLLAERDEIAVLMHPNPDPDAMSAALGVASLAEQLDVDATVQYPGQIRHQENRAFRTCLTWSWTRSNT